MGRRVEGLSLLPALAAVALALYSWPPYSYAIPMLTAVAFASVLLARRFRLYQLCYRIRIDYTVDSRWVSSRLLEAVKKISTHGETLLTIDDAKATITVRGGVESLARVVEEAGRILGSLQDTVTIEPCMDSVSVCSMPDTIDVEKLCGRLDDAVVLDYEGASRVGDCNIVRGDKLSKKITSVEKLIGRGRIVIAVKPRQRHVKELIETCIKRRCILLVVGVENLPQCSIAT